MREHGAGCKPESDHSDMPYGALMLQALAASMKCSEIMLMQPIEIVSSWVPVVRSGSQYILGCRRGFAGSLSVCRTRQQSRI
jgi:hypothetical protein